MNQAIMQKLRYHEDQFITLPDVAGETLHVRYWDVGDGEEVIFFLHGIAACVESWAWTIEPLLPHYRILAPDFPGHGRTSAPSNPHFYQVGTIIEAAADFLNAMDVIAPVHVVGNSAGGTAALHLAIHHPQWVKNLVVIDPAGLHKTIHLAYRLPGTLPFVNTALTLPPVQSVVRWVFQQVVTEKPIGNVCAEQIYYYLEQEHTRRAIVYLLQHGTSLDGMKHIFKPSELQGIANPTLILWGEHDPVIPASQADIALQHIPDSRAVIFRHSRHAPQVDRADEVAQLLHQFFRDNRLDDETEAIGKVYR